MLNTGLWFGVATGVWGAAKPGPLQKAATALSVTLVGLSALCPEWSAKPDGYYHRPPAAFARFVVNFLNFGWKCAAMTPKYRAKEVMFAVGDTIFGILVVIFAGVNFADVTPKANNVGRKVALAIDSSVLFLTTAAFFGICGKLADVGRAAFVARVCNFGFAACLFSAAVIEDAA